MKKNMGTTDRAIRILVAAVIVVLFFANVISGPLSIILLIMAGIFVVTGVLGFCPLYMLFGWSIKKKE